MGITTRKESAYLCRIILTENEICPAKKEPHYYMFFFLECHFSMRLNQFHWKHNPMKRMNPAPSTSANAVKNELCGDKPAVAIDSILPSKLQGTINIEDLMPFNAFLATSSAFIPPEDPAMILVRSGLLLCSVFSNKVLVIMTVCFRKMIESKYVCSI